MACEENARTKKEKERNMNALAAMYHSDSSELFGFNNADSESLCFPV